MGPYTSEYTISQGLVAHLPPSFENAALCCLSSMHASQSKEDVGKKICQGSYHLSYFGGYEHTLRSNSHSGGAKI